MDRGRGRFRVRRTPQSATLTFAAACQSVPASRRTEFRRGRSPRRAGWPYGLIGPVVSTRATGLSAPAVGSRNSRSLPGAPRMAGSALARPPAPSLDRCSGAGGAATSQARRSSDPRLTPWRSRQGAEECRRATGPRLGHPEMTGRAVAEGRWEARAVLEHRSAWPSRTPRSRRSAGGTHRRFRHAPVPPWSLLQRPPRTVFPGSWRPWNSRRPRPIRHRCWIARRTSSLPPTRPRQCGDSSCRGRHGPRRPRTASPAVEGSL